MKYFLTLATALLISATAGFAQLQLPALQQVQQQLNASYRLQRQQLEKRAKEQGLPMRWKDDAGHEVELTGFDELGMPVYVITDNVVAANSTATSRVYPGGSLGYNLTGAGMTVGEWDGGATRLTHQELNGRAVQVDGATTLSNHATHVAGTLIGGGVQPNARGMAWEANLATYDWNNDNAEMTAAAQNGLLVSNHSYGQIAGWYSSGGVWYWYGTTSISETLDWNFGFYNSKAQQWDQIAVNNPFYLIVKSAGNNRNQGPSAGTSHQVRNANGQWVTSTTVRPRSGPYDCLPTYSVAKNILTIGAVNDLNNGWQSAAGVGMSSFSSWGPTDDGRIKPDIVGNGVGLYSSYSGSNTAYASISGTSMSGPNVAGSLILIQQRFQQVHNRFMRSSTLKALSIHTADEAGPDPGPDYMFGWGLLNTGRAVQLIDNVDAQSLLEEHTLEDQATWQLAASHPQAGPLRVSIAWTDPAATPPPASLNPSTRMLVNDLDLRLIHVPTNTVYSPWILDPANPSAAAQTGDNNRDNVEQVFVANAPAGEYLVVISHKGSLRQGQPQAFGLVATGLVKGLEANFTASSRFVCVGDTVQFASTSAGASQYAWSFPGANPTTDTTAQPRVVYNNPGIYPVSLAVSGLQGTDTLLRSTYMYVGRGVALPFTEDFENEAWEDRGWRIENPDSARTWALTNVGGSSTGSRAAFMDFYNYNQSGAIDRMTAPPVDLTGLGSASLQFRHAYRRYNSSTSDSLRIKVSVDCGQNWTTVLAVGGNTMATAAASTSNFVPATAADWCGAGSNLACFNVALDSFVGQPQVWVQFEAVNAYGNNLYIDDVVVTGVPNVLPQAALTQSVNRLCAGDSVQFGDVSTGLPNARSWLFPGGSPASSTDPQPRVAYPGAGTYNVSLIVQNVVGFDTLVIAQAVQVDALPSVSMAALPVVCSTDGVLTLTAGQPAGGYYSGTGVVGSQQFDPALAGPGLHDIIYTYTQNGCVANVTAQITVTATPQASLALILPQCVQNGAIALVQGSPSGGTYLGPGVNGNLFDPALAGVGSHTIRYVLSNGNCADTASTQVVVTAAPQASITALPSLCTDGGTRLLQGQPQGGNFSGPGVNFGVFNALQAGPGVHDVRYIVSVNGCTDTALMQVEVLATPAQPEITVQGSQLVSSALSGNRWYRNGQLLPNDTGRVLLPALTGNYQVQVQNGGCVSPLSTAFVVSQVSVAPQGLAGVEVFPNPTSDRLQVRWEAALYQVRNLALYNALGQKVLETEVRSQGQAAIDVGTLPEGTYQLMLNGDRQTFSTTFLIRR